MKILYPTTQRPDESAVTRTCDFHAYPCLSCTGLGYVYLFSYDDCDELDDRSHMCPTCEGWGSHTDGTEVFRDMVFVTVIAIHDSWMRDRP